MYKISEMVGIALLLTFVKVHFYERVFFLYKSLVLTLVKVRKTFTNVLYFACTFTNAFDRISERKVDEGVKKWMSVNLDT